LSAWLGRNRIATEQRPRKSTIVFGMTKKYSERNWVDSLTDIKTMRLSSTLVRRSRAIP
jgi:hypothetical protein